MVKILRIIFVGKISQAVLKLIASNGHDVIGYFYKVEDFAGWKNTAEASSGFDRVLVIPSALTAGKELQELNMLQATINELNSEADSVVFLIDESIITINTSTEDFNLSEGELFYSPNLTMDVLLSALGKDNKRLNPMPEEVAHDNTAIEEPEVQSPEVIEEEVVREAQTEVEPESVFPEVVAESVSSGPEDVNTEFLAEQEIVPKKVLEHETELKEESSDIEIVNLSSEQVAVVSEEEAIDVVSSEDKVEFFEASYETAVVEETATVDPGNSPQVETDSDDLANELMQQRLSTNTLPLEVEPELVVTKESALDVKDEADIVERVEIEVTSMAVEEEVESLADEEVVFTSIEVDQDSEQNKELSVSSEEESARLEENQPVAEIETALVVQQAEETKEITPLIIEDSLGINIFEEYQEPTEPVDQEIERKRAEINAQLEKELEADALKLSKLERYNPPIGKYEGVDAKTIVVASLFSGTGATFIASNMATVLAASGISSSVVEHLGNTPVLYNYLYGDVKHPDNWRSIAFRVEEEAAVNGRDYWQDGELFWFPLERNQIGLNSTAEKMSHYMNATRVAQYTFVDVSTNWSDESLFEVYNSCAEIWLVLQPNVAKIMEPLMRFKEHMGRWPDKVKFIVNMVDSYTRTKEVLDEIDFLISNPPGFVENPQYHLNKAQREYYIWRDEQVATVIPTFSRSEVNKAEWQGTVFASSPEGSQQVVQGFTGLINVVAPDEQILERKKKPKLLGFLKRNRDVG
jgi:hypothetical protein